MNTHKLSVTEVELQTLHRLLHDEINRRYRNASTVDHLLTPDMRTLRELHNKIHEQFNIIQ